MEMGLCFFSFSIEASKCSGSCNNINYPYVNIDKEVCDKGFIWNTINCESECDKASGVGEYLDYGNFKCRKKLVAPLIEECTGTVEEVKLAKISLAKNESGSKCSFCTVYIVLFSTTFTINVGIVTYCVYSQWYLKKDASHVNCNTRTQTLIY